MHPRSTVVLGALLVTVTGLPGTAIPAAGATTDARIQAIEDPSSPIAAAKKAVEELGDAEEARAVPALIKLLYEPHQGRTLAPEAAFALFEIGKPSADALLKVVQSKDPDLQAWAAAHHVAEALLWTEAASVLADLGDPRAQAPLLRLLRDRSANPQLELFVQRRVASALGRLHSRPAVDRLAELVTVDDMQARHEVERALVQIGGRAGLPAVERAAGAGSWELRQIGLDGFTMLGGGADRPAFQKMMQREADIITADCRAHPGYVGCHDQPALLPKMLGRVRGFGRRLDAAARCGQDVPCWTARLQDADPGVRERAVLELARRATGKQVDPLFTAAGDPDAAVRLAAVQALEWLLANDAGARAVGQRHIPALEASRARGQDTVGGARFDAPLRRILHRLRVPRAAATATTGRRPA